MTSFFDWFSVPLITFGIPVIAIILYQAKQDPTQGFVQYFRTAFNCGVGWCLGYGSMLAGRVLISTVVEGSGSLDNFLARVVYNITSSGNQEGADAMERLNTILNGFRGVFPLSMTTNNKVVLAVLMVCFVLVAAAVVRNFKRWPYITVIAMISLAPFAWFVVFNGYCRVHFWIAFRMFVITIFAWLSIAAVCLNAPNGKAEQSEESGRI